MGIKEKPPKARSSIAALGGFIQIENNNLSFIFLQRLQFSQAVLWEHPAAAKWGGAVSSQPKMFRKSQISRRKRLQNRRKQKVTVADIVSTTVTDLVAGEGLEPPTSGL